LLSFFPADRTPSSLPAASAGAELPARPRIFISMVLLTAMAAVPASPAARPTPAAAATCPARSPILLPDWAPCGRAPDAGSSAGR
jgi:hypothetical protein